jgi:hypothetical protein
LREIDSFLARRTKLKYILNHYFKQTFMTKKKVTGIGGIFFKCNDPEKMKDWYNNNLGLVTNEYGSTFEFRHADEPDKKGYLAWSPFNSNTKYFEPSKKNS